MKVYEIVLKEWTPWDSMLEEALRASGDRVFKETVQASNYELNISSDNYRPLSEASEGYVFTGICLSKSGGEVLHQMHHVINHMVRRGEWTTPPPPAGTRSQHLPPPPLGPGLDNTFPPPWDQVWTTPPPPPWDQVWTIPSPPPLGPGLDNTSPPLGPGLDNTSPPPGYAQAGGTHPTGMHPC